MKKKLKFYNLFSLIDKKRFLLSIKILVLFVCLVVTIYFTPVVFSKYESDTVSVANANIAFYLLKENYYTESLQLVEMVPRSAPYAYSFTVSNNDGTNRLETDLEYDLTIVTTTNLPLDYELYLNETYNASGATNIIVNDTTATDVDGTYFRTMTTPKETFGFTENQTNTYTLVVYFPSTYISYLYQDILENIEIIINSKQIL